MNDLKDILIVDKFGNHDKAMQLLYSDIYDMLVESKIDDCETYLQNFLEMDFSVNLQVAFTRITKPVKDKLKSRETLVLKLKENLFKECSTEEAENVLSHVV